MLLTPLSYVAVAACFVFVTLSLASGLLYIAEIIEEHSRTAKTVGQRAIYAIILLHVLLCVFDRLPLHLVAFSIVCHLVYLQNFGPAWPLISLRSVSFLGSCVLVVADHFAWFYHFARALHDARRNTYYRPHTPAPRTVGPTFIEVAAFFGICIWLVPLFLFLSLSANDNALPTSQEMSSRPSTPVPGQAAAQPTARISLFKSIFDALLDILPVRLRSRGRRNADGIIASYHPPSRPSSPAPSRRGSSEFTLAPPPMRRGSLQGNSDARLTPRVASGRRGAEDEHGFMRPPSPLRQMIGPT